MDMQERNRQLHEQRKADLRGDFEPFYPPESPVKPEMRLAIAAEYAAFQLGHINKKLDRLTVAVERLAGSEPDPRSFSQIKAERETKRER